jgi:hypothetical protein
VFAKTERKENKLLMPYIVICYFTNERLTMDFERAAERLKKDHSKIQRRRPVATSAQAKQQAERAKQQRQQDAAEREKKRRQEEYITEYYRQCERKF